MIKKHWGYALALCLVYTSDLTAQIPKDKWVDSVFSRMNIADKIGQLFMVRLSPNQGESSLNELENKIRNNSLGGILYTRGQSVRVANLTNRLQSASKIPLITGIDGNGNDLLQIDSVTAFPSPLAQGAVANDSLILLSGKEIARQMKSMGLHINFIPVYADNNTDQLAFGENRSLATAKTIAFWNGLQSENVLACAKYFPAQGVRVIDIQKGFPVIQLYEDSARTYPFKVLINNGLSAVMPASTDLPLFFEKKKTARKNKYSSGALSAAFSGDWIRQNLNFGGLIFVDLDNLPGAFDKFSPGDAEKFAFQAGNDMIVTSANVSPAIRKMKKLLRKEKQYTAQLNNSVKKILALKYDAGLQARRKIETENLRLNVVSPQIKSLQQKIYAASITIAKNEGNILPLQSFDDTRFIVLQAGDSVKGKVFSKFVSKYTGCTVMQVNEKTESLNLTDTVYRKKIIIAAVFPSTSENTLINLMNILKERDTTRQVIICDFGAVALRKYAHEFPAVIAAYTDDREMLELVPQVVFGGRSAEGSLPVSFGNLPQGTSIKTGALKRLTYSFPEDAGMDASTLTKIESIAREAIDIGATPGCHVLVAREGKIVYERSFGYLTYEKQTPVTDETIYDLASVTKVLATLQTVMFMHERGLIDINKKVSAYLPELKKSNKKDFILKDILTHQAGLWPFLPFWAQTMKDSLFLPEFYDSVPSHQYPLVVADKLYASTAMKDSLWSWIIKARIREKPARTPFDYRYSDMGFYILQHLAETLLNQPIEDFLEQNLYGPLGASGMGYRPLLRFPILQIAPTENDRLFRKALLIGTVHDQGAAMQGGIAGHAGLFGSATDLAKLGQMLLQEGNYGGYQYYKPETVRYFTQKQFVSSRRGLGWDKPTTGDWNGPTSLHASPKTFGHTGFTGTCIWVDPEFNLVYVFLSNRVHPDMTNNKLLSANIRSRIQDVIYQSIFNYCKTAEPQPDSMENSPLEASGKPSQ